MGRRKKNQAKPSSSRPLGADAGASKRRYLLDRATRFAERGDLERADVSFCEAYDDPDGAEAVLWALAWAPALSLHRLERARASGTMPAHTGETLATALFAAAVDDVMRAADVSGVDDAWRESAQVVIDALERLDSAATDELVAVFERVSKHPDFAVAAAFGANLCQLGDLDRPIPPDRLGTELGEHPVSMSFVRGSDELRAVANPDLAHLDAAVGALKRGRSGQAQAALERLEGHVPPSLVEVLGRCAMTGGNERTALLHAAERHAGIVGRPQDAPRYQAMVFEDLGQRHEGARLRRDWVVACRHEQDRDRRALLGLSCLDIAWQILDRSDGLELPGELAADSLFREDDPTDPTERQAIAWLRVARSFAPDESVVLAGGWSAAAERLPDHADEFEAAYTKACGDQPELDLVRAALATKASRWGTAISALLRAAQLGAVDRDSREELEDALLDALAVPPSAEDAATTESLREAVRLVRPNMGPVLRADLEAALLAREMAGCAVVPPECDGLAPWTLAVGLVSTRAGIEPDADPQAVRATVSVACDLAGGHAPSNSAMWNLIELVPTLSHRWQDGVGRLLELAVLGLDAVPDNMAAAILNGGALPETPESVAWSWEHRWSSLLGWALWLSRRNAPPSEHVDEALAGIRVRRAAMDIAELDGSLAPEDIRMNRNMMDVIEGPLIELFDRTSSPEKAP